LKSSQGDFVNCWDAVDNFILLQVNEIERSFQQSKIVVEHRVNNKFYSKLRGLVSRNALDLILQQHEKVKITGVDENVCGCVVRRTYGLPCACQLARCTMDYAFIPLDMVDPFWRTLWILDDDQIQKQPSDNTCAMHEVVEAL
jgi:hypothetical protein